MRIHANDDFRCRLARASEGGDGIAYNFIKVRQLARRIVMFCIGAHAIDDFVGAFGLSEDFAQCECESLLVELSLLCAPVEAPRKIDDGGQRLLELMRDDGRHLSDYARPLKVGNVLPRLRCFCLDQIALGERTPQLSRLHSNKHRKTHGIRNDEEGHKQR